MTAKEARRATGKVKAEMRAIAHQEAKKEYAQAQEKIRKAAEQGDSRCALTVAGWAVATELEKLFAKDGFKTHSYGSHHVDMEISW